MKVYSCSLFLLVFPFCMGFAQVDSIYFKEQQLKVMGDSILRGSTDSVRSSYCNIFNAKFEDLLKDPSSIHYRFDSLKTVSVVTSKDKSLRIYTWILPSVNRNQYSYFGFVQYSDKKTKQFFLSKLKEGNLSKEEIEKKSLNTENWQGAVYYRMIENKIKKEKIYTLLGWIGNNLQTKMKIIDVLIIDKGVIKFGTPIFNIEKGVKHRIIFEYSSQAVMSLRYDDKRKMIIFDHLSPASSQLKDNFSSYGPDMTYDGFRFKKGKWMYQKNIEVKNPSELDARPGNSTLKSKEFYNPEK